MKVSHFHLHCRFSTMPLRLACPLAISVPSMGTYCSSVNYAISKEWSWDEINLKLYILDMSLMFERKCKKSNKWTCPGVTYASEPLVVHSIFFYSVLILTSATDLQCQMVLTRAATNNYFHLACGLGFIWQTKPKDFHISITETKKSKSFFLNWLSK